MRTRLIFGLSAAGLLLGIVGAIVLTVHATSNPPVFSPASNPYDRGIYANGIVESEQASGANVNVFPEVAGTVTEILVREGQIVTRGTPLLSIEDSVQRTTTEQQEAQAETAAAQIVAARASLKMASDQLVKQRRSHEVEPRSVSQAVLDDLTNAERVAHANLEVATRQEVALRKAAAAGKALLAKYTIRAPIDGTVLSVNAALGDYVSPQGMLDTYTRGTTPVAVIGQQAGFAAVRAFVDEILIAKLGPLDRVEATMYVRGTDVRVPLEFVRVQPYVSPKIELSDARTERVDLRVLPLIFRFKRTAELHLYPGQLVDVYVRTP